MENGLSIQEVYVSPPLFGIDAVLRRLCKIFAATGGIVLTGLTLVTVASVLGRALFGTPIPGDFELVELGCAIAVSAFLPYCQIQEGNVIVDLVTAKAPKSVNHILGALGDLLLFAISALICWRMVHGCYDLIDYEEVSMVLEIPIWWAFPPMIISFALLCVACLSTMLNNLWAAKNALVGKKGDVAQTVVPDSGHGFVSGDPEGAK